MSVPTPKVQMIHRVTGATANVSARSTAVHEAAGWLQADEYHRLHAPRPARPRNSDSKGVWVDYAVALGWETADAEALTKEPLIEQLDQLVAELEAAQADDDTEPAGDGTDTESQED